MTILSKFISNLRPILRRTDNRSRFAMANNVERRTFRKWLPLIGLTFSTFIFNTSEFIPIGLLTDIADDFSITEQKAGLLITFYAWVVAVMSLPLMLAFSKTENRKLLLSVVGLFTLSHVMSGFSTGYYMLMASRVGVACAHAIFWSMVTPLAVKVAPDGNRSLALSLIVTGSSVAMIVGLPLGRAIGIMVGWRITFLLIGAIAAMIFVILASVLPKVPSDNDVTLKSLPSLIKTPALIGIYVLTVIMITGHFTAYSYIEPFLDQIAGLGSNAITMVLAGFGIVGIIGSLFFSKYYDRHNKAFILIAIMGIPALMLSLWISAHVSPWMIVLNCLLWGIAINSYNLTFQSEILQHAPHGTAIAMSIYSGIYNVGIGSGALVGGIVCEHVGIGCIGYIGAAIAFVAMLWCLVKFMPVACK